MVTKLPNEMDDLSFCMRQQCFRSAEWFDFNKNLCRIVRLIDKVLLVLNQLVPKNP